MQLEKLLQRSFGKKSVTHKQHFDSYKSIFFLILLLLILNLIKTTHIMRSFVIQPSIQFQPHHHFIRETLETVNVLQETQGFKPCTKVEVRLVEMIIIYNNNLIFLLM